MSTAVLVPGGWQAQFMQVLPAIRTHAQIQFRHLPLVHREEAVQEAIAAACVSYQRLAAQGRLHVARPGTLATFAVKHVRNGRHVGGRQDGARDVLSPACQRRHGVRVLSCDVRRRKRDGNDWKRLVIAGPKDPIPDTAAFRIDFERWLRMLRRRDRKMVKAFIKGNGTFAVARRFALSPARVSQLRSLYRLDWRRFQGEAVGGREEYEG